MVNVSIIIPVYNVSAYIERCIKSVMRQTFSGFIECIIVDDCSPDDSIEKCSRIIKSYNGNVQFRILRHEKNKGLSEARNTGTNNAAGRYIYYLDSDDELPQNAIEVLWTQVEKHPNIDVVMGATFSSFNKEYYSINQYRDHSFTCNRKWIQYNCFTSKKNIAVNAWNKLLRHELILNHDLYFMPGIIHEDQQWFFYLVKYVQSWAFVFEDTYIHYRTENSIMTTLNRKKEAKNWHIIMLDHSCHFYGPYKRLQLLKYMNMYFNHRIFEYHFSGSRKLHYNFIIASLEEKQWKVALLLCAWTLLYSFHDGFRLKRWLMKYSSMMYELESERCYEKL